MHSTYEANDTEGFVLHHSVLLDTDDVDEHYVLWNVTTEPGMGS